MNNEVKVKEYLEMLGKRIKDYRVNCGITQEDLYKRTGVSIRSISRAEQGKSLQMDVFIRLLNGLHLSSNLSLLIPDQSIRPSYYLIDKSKQKSRVRKKKDNENRFIWGDEK